MGDTKYGWLRGGSVPAIEVPLLSGAEVNGGLSGRLCTIDSSGRIVMATGTEADLHGHVVSGTILSADNTADGQFVLKVIRQEAGGVYRLPVTTGTYAATMKNKSCDLTITSASPDVQGVDLTASTYDTVVIVDGDLVNNDFVDVMIADPGASYTGVV